MTREAAYDRDRKGATERSRKRSAAGREVGPLPKVKNRKRRDRCREDFKLFCETYFPARFGKPWGRDHLEIIATLQRVVTAGGQFAVAAPRGSGKTALASAAVLFAVLYGWRRFVVFIGSTAKTAQDRLNELIREELETNPILHEDFPAATHCVRRLERNTTRARMQVLDGEFTRVSWGAGELRLATIPGAMSSGARVMSAGLATGDLRGILRHAPDGSLDRPDLVIGDDLQSDESARMPGQCDTRESVLNNAVLGLGGPGVKIAAVVLATVIRPNDLSDRLLDRRRNPEWQGRTFRLMDRMPDRLDLWEQYGNLLRDGLQEDPPTRQKANEFYAARRAEMDRGAEPTWPARYDPDQLSAVQFAMDLYLLKPATFFAEYQNAPLAASDAGGAEPIDPSAVAEKLNHVPRGTVPVECSRLTCFVDIKQEIVFWAVCAWDEKFGGAVIDYGTHPRQHGSRFSGTDPSPSLSEVYRAQGLALEARLYAALTAVAADVLGRSFPRADGGPPMRVELCLVDAGWGPYAELIHQWCRQTPYAATVKASKGVYVGATKTPFSEWRHQPGDRRGPGWRIRTGGTDLGRLVSFDSNLFKNFVAERLRTPMGSPGCLTLFGGNPAVHGLFCDHLAAEHPVRVTAGGRTVDEWQLNPGRPDNDWLDCLTGCCVAASVLGLRWDAAAAAGQPVEKPEPRPARRFSEIQRSKLQKLAAGGCPAWR